MIVTEYHESVTERLLTDETVTALPIIRTRATLTDGYMRARLTLVGGSQLEFAEYVQRSAHDRIEVVTYSYHWTDAQGDLIRRWDNTPHFPDLPRFPHHVHEGPAGAVGPGDPVDIFAVLDEIAKGLSSSQA